MLFQVSENCRPICNALFLSKLEKHMHFSHSPLLPKIARWFVNAWLWTDCKSACNSQKLLSHRKLQANLQRTIYQQIGKAHAFLALTSATENCTMICKCLTVNGLQISPQFPKVSQPPKIAGLAATHSLSADWKSTCISRTHLCYRKLMLSCW